MLKINKLAVIGVGLIGGSFALAVKQAGAVRQVIGAGRSADQLTKARLAGVVDEVTENPADAVRGADLVMLAVPVAQSAAILKEIAPVLEAYAVITDVGSTKAGIVKSARTILGSAFARFVPAHPIAGAETSGVGAAHAELFRGRQVVLTPQAETDGSALQRVRELWESCGAETSVLDAETHDAIFASVSHLPHLLAFALVDLIAKRPNAAQLFSFCGSGFRDFTRIAGSSPEMWRDIALANRDALLLDLAAYRNEIIELERLIGEGDGEALERLFARARESRSRYLTPQQTLEQAPKRL